MVPLRLQSMALPVRDLAAVARFYRWALQLKGAPEEDGAGAVGLAWGHEDRIRLLDLDAAPDAEAAVTLRMPAIEPAAAAEWCVERNLTPVAVAVAPHDAARAAELWPEVPVTEVADPAGQNVTTLSVRGPAGPRIDLGFPLPKELLTPRNQMGPFYWKSRDWSGLEIPGLLGVTTRVPDRAAFREFCAALGLAPMEPGDEAAPLLAGDHQWIVEEGEPAGLMGLAVVLSASRIPDFKRTLEHLEADHRLDGNRLLTVDPAGRVILLTGVRGA